MVLSTSRGRSRPVHRFSRVRAFAAQTRVSKMAVKRYYRCLDGLTGAEYYFDPKTGT